MPEERRLNAEARERLDLIQVGYERFSHRVRMILVVLTMAQVGLGMLSIHLLGQNSHRVDENHQLITRVQDERAAAARLQCEDVNRRNRNTQAEIDRLLPKGTPAKRVKPTRILIDKLLPLRNCDEFVGSFVKARP